MQVPRNKTLFSENKALFKIKIVKTVLPYLFLKYCKTLNCCSFVNSSVYIYICIVRYNANILNTGTEMQEQTMQTLITDQTAFRAYTICFYLKLLNTLLAGKINFKFYDNYSTFKRFQCLETLRYRNLSTGEVSFWCFSFQLHQVFYSIKCNQHKLLKKLMQAHDSWPVQTTPYRF